MTKRQPLSGRQSNTSRSAADGAGIDLARLRDMHPLLPPDMVAIVVVRAALGLQRNKHAPGANLETTVESDRLRCVLTWPLADLDTAKQHDHNQITEDGAEAIALAVAHRLRAWRVVRRLQHGEYADWLLEYRDKGKRHLVAFEVSGTDKGDISDPMREKLAQVAKSADVDQRWAGVVGFRKPETALRSAKRRSHGR